MPLLLEVRQSCAQIAEAATDVIIDRDAFESLSELGPVGTPALDEHCHHLSGSPSEVADYMLALDAINFGSGWFPLLSKATLRGRQLSGCLTVALRLADHVRAGGAITPAWLRSITTEQIAQILRQSPSLELISLYAQALRSLGRFLGDRRALDLVSEANGSAERFAGMLTAGMPMFADVGFYKRAQIAAHDLQLAGVASFHDIDELTIFADNLVPHVLRVSGVLRYSERLASQIDSGGLLPLGGLERQIRACALHACELISKQSGLPPRIIDNWLWNCGQQPHFKAKPRHRCRCVFY